LPEARRSVICVPLKPTVGVTGALRTVTLTLPRQFRKALPHIKGSDRSALKTPINATEAGYHAPSGSIW
jgi:hypothetical protein